MFIIRRIDNSVNCSWQKYLEKNKDKFIAIDENGKEDTAPYQMAAAMLAYINANAVGFNDGINYVDECVDIGQSRETFKMIFNLMGKGQHDEMMMGA